MSPATMTRLSDYAHEQDFGRWLAEVDAVVSIRLGVSLLDMPDQGWRDRFDCGMSPDEAADEAMEQWVSEGDMPAELID